MTKTLADIIIHLAGSISNEKALAMRNACDALEGRIDALERVLSRHAETLGFLDYERVQPLEARVSTLEASQPSTQNAWDAYRFVMDSEHPGAAYRDVERMAVDAAVRATTNTGASEEARGACGSGAFQPHLSRPEAAQAAQEKVSGTHTPDASAPSASVPMTTRERETILKNDEIALAIADGMSLCANVFLDDSQPGKRCAVARMAHGRLADARVLLARLIASRAPRASTVSVEEMAERLRDAWASFHGVRKEGYANVNVEYWTALACAALSALPASEAPQPSHCCVHRGGVCECDCHAGVGAIMHTRDEALDTERRGDPSPQPSRAAQPNTGTGAPVSTQHPETQDDGHELRRHVRDPERGPRAALGGDGSEGRIPRVDAAGGLARAGVQAQGGGPGEAARGSDEHGSGSALGGNRQDALPGGADGARAERDKTGVLLERVEVLERALRTETEARTHDDKVIAGRVNLLIRRINDDGTVNAVEIAAQPAPASTPPIRAVAGTSLACPKCGCRWKMHADGSLQLYDADQRPCVECDNAPNAPLRPETPDDAPASTPDLTDAEAKRLYDEAEPVPFGATEVERFVRTTVDPQAEVLALQKQRNDVYEERDRLVCALSKCFPSWLARHPDTDKAWDDDWRWIVFVELPNGQATWHIQDRELPWFSHLDRRTENVWDGHTTEEKYRRLALLRPASTPDEGEDPGWLYDQLQEYAAAARADHSAERTRRMVRVQLAVQRRLSSSRPPRVDVRMLLASYYGEDPFDRNVDRMTAALKSQGVECVGEKESAA